MNLLIKWLVVSIVIIVSAYIFPGIIVKGFLAALATAVVLGFVNAVIKPILIFLTLPINLLTLGLFTLVINAILVLVAAFVVPGFSVVNFWWALLLGIILSLVNLVLNPRKKL